MIGIYDLLVEAKPFMRRINSSRSECMQRSPTGALEITLNYSTDAGTGTGMRQPFNRGGRPADYALEIGPF